MDYGFWGLNDTGIGSRAGALIHEASHFIAEGGITDYACSPDDVKKLAIKSPDKAAMNAANHQYFASEDREE